MLFMVIGRFKHADAAGVYRRFRERGRMAPEGLKYHGSWVAASLDRCFQLMECDDPRLLQEWILNWRDIVELELVPVVASKETSDLVAPVD